MSEERPEVSLDFMYKYCDGYRYQMWECISIPEVRKRMTEIYYSGCLLTPKVFAEVLKSVHDEKYADKKNNPDFCYRSARKIVGIINTMAQE